MTQRERAVSQTQVREEAEVIWTLGFCVKCLRLLENAGPCPVCHTDLDMPWEVRGELLEEHARLLLALQHLFNEEPEVKLSLNPMWRANMTWPECRRSIVALRGVAAQRGLLPAELRPPTSEEGRTIIITYADGERWECFEDAKTGAIRRLRLLEDEPVEPEEQEEPEAEAERPSGSVPNTEHNHDPKPFGRLVPGCPRCNMLRAAKKEEAEVSDDITTRGVPPSRPKDKGHSSPGSPGIGGGGSGGSMPHGKEATIKGMPATKPNTKGGGSGKAPSRPGVGNGSGGSRGGK